MNNNISFNEIIREICKEKNIQYTLLSKDWITMLEKDNKIRFITGYKFGINNHALGEIIDDKYALFCVLKSKQIPVVEHNILYAKTNTKPYAQDSNQYDLVKDYFLKHNKKIVIKSNTGTCGVGVYLIENEDEIENILDELFLKNFSISYCPYYSIKSEYRVILLDNEVKLMYKKIRPIVYGDGVKTIKELLIDFNKNYFQDKLEEEVYSKVLEKNQQFQYNWKFNLSRGATANIVDDKELENRLKTLATKATTTLNIRFCSVDIIETEENEFRILEINSGVMMDNAMGIFKDGKKIAKQIYEEAIDKMFM